VGRLGKMGLRSAYERMRYVGFEQGMGYVLSLVEAWCGCWGKCVYVRVRCIELAQGHV